MIANEAGIPSTRTETAASAGPIARARLNVIELSATAEASWSRGTRSPIIAIATGFVNALATPRPSANTITAQTRASPAQASPASAPLDAVAKSCDPIRSHRRSKRSAALPDHGASSSTGMKFEKLRTPSRNAECVSR